MDTHEQFSVPTDVFVALGYTARSRIVGSHGKFMFAFLRKCQTVCTLDVSFYITTDKYEDSIFFSTPLSTLAFVSFLL